MARRANEQNGAASPGFLRSGVEEQGRGRCRLCLQEAVRLKKSHVLSEFLYEPTYERYDPEKPKQGRMLEVPADTGEKLRYLHRPRHKFPRV